MVATFDPRKHTNEHENFGNDVSWCLVDRAYLNGQVLIRSQHWHWLL
jgi:hypothetical protein